MKKIWIDERSLNVKYLTIGDAQPLGICGSGIVVLLGEMRLTELIDSSGRLSSDIDHPKIRRGSEGREFVVVKDENIGTGDDISITQRDVRELQKAKAAVYTAASILMKQMDVTTNDMDKVFIAGAFGNCIDPGNMKTIGMIPDFSPDIIVNVGNAAGTGARMALLSRKVRQRADRVRKKVKYIELAANPLFSEEYIRVLDLPHSH